MQRFPQSIGRNATNPLFRLLLCLALVLAIAAPGEAESARGYYNRGRAAEVRRDYIAAFENYKQAYEQKPSDQRFRVAYERSRFFAASEYVKRGIQARAQGDLDGALKLFEQAKLADPSFADADQEIERTEQMRGAGKTGPTEQDSSDQVLKHMVQQAPGPIELRPFNNDLISINTTEDSKKLYQTIGQLAGINVIFDPDYVGRRVPLQLDRVTLDDALNVLADLTGTFWRPITPNTIQVAQNTRNKRTDLETQVYKTIYLSNITGGAGQGTNDMGELVQAIRTMTDIQKIQQIVSQNAIAVRGTPDQVALAEKIAADFDKARPEVVIDVAVIRVRRDKIRNLGFSPPGSVSIGLQPNGTTTTSTTGTGTTTSGTGTTTTGTTTNNTTGITLNTFNNLTAKDFAVSISTATLNALLTDSDTHVMQNPQIRAESGQKASLKIGDRVPVATGSYGTGLGVGGVGGVGGIGALNGLLGTNFQYIDVGVNIDVTPTVYANRDVGLKLTFEVSQVTSQQNIGGINQPVISQSKIDHEIRLKDGEVNLIGGLIEEDQLKSLSGLPFLSELPVLKYLFGSESVEKVDSELVFVLIPHIVRSQFLSDLNTRAIDVGTQNGIDLRRHTAAPNVEGGAAPPVRDVRTPAEQQGVAPSNGAPPQTSPPSTSQQGNPTTQPPQGEVRLSVDPPAGAHNVGETFAVNVNVANATDLSSVPIQITYDPKVLSILNVSNGDFLSRDGQPAVLVKRDDNVNGQLVISASRPPDAPGISGSGTVYTITLQAKQRGHSVFAITKPSARNAQQQFVTVLGAQADITVQ